MRFGLSEKQLSFARDTVARCASLEASDGNRDPWATAAYLNSGRWLVPKLFGGDGRNLLDVAVAIEEISKAGRVAAILGGAVLAPLAVLAHGDDSQRKKWLADICNGSARFAVAFEADAGRPLSDEIPVLIDAPGANFILLYRGDGSVSILAANHLVHRLTPSIDDDRVIGSIPCAAQPIAALVAAAHPSESMQRVLNAGRIALAAETLGAAQELCDRAVDYVQGRVQFGRAIGSYQGVKFNCADMVTMLEPCRALVWHAAYAFDAGLEEADLVALHAKAHVGDVAREVARMSVELHGAYGFSQKSGLHRWVRRIGFNRQVLGSPDDCRAMAGELQQL